MDGNTVAAEGAVLEVHIRHLNVRLNPAVEPAGSASEFPHVVHVVIVKSNLVVAFRAAHGHIVETVFLKGLTVAFHAISPNFPRIVLQGKCSRLFVIHEDSHILVHHFGDFLVDEIRLSVSLNLVFLNVGHTQVLRRELLIDLRQIPLVGFEDQVIPVHTTQHGRIPNHGGSHAGNQIGALQVGGYLLSGCPKRVHNQVIGGGFSIGSGDEQGPLRIHMGEMGNEVLLQLQCKSSGNIGSVLSQKPAQEQAELRPP